MNMASTVSRFLSDHSVKYRVIPHDHSATSRESAHKADIREDRVAKAVMLEDKEGMVMAIIPASSGVDMRAIRDETGRNHLEMMDEHDLSSVFPDCELGALPLSVRPMALPPWWIAASTFAIPFTSSRETMKSSSH